jgi:formylglycine-generating enzyme
VPGADWLHPQGPGSSLAGREDHPVVHVAWDDAVAFAFWAGKELPSEAEWEFAARGGLDGATYPWGEEFTPGGRWIGQHLAGPVPHPQHRRGRPPRHLYDMIGNVWEWTTDWYQAHPRSSHSCCTAENPHGGIRQASVDPSMPNIPIPRRVMKGGSHLCAPNYCRRYRPVARMPQPIDTSTSHLGFRCISRA